MADRNVNLTIGVVARAAGGAALGAAAVAGKIPGALASGASALAGGPAALVASQAVQMAGKADPAGFAELMRIFDDLQAVVGQVFVPVLKIVSPLLQAFADILDAVITPAMKFLEPIITAVANALNFLIDALFDFLNSVSETIRDLTLGFVDLGKLERGRATGKAAGQASYVGVEEIGKQSQLAAYGAGRNFAERTANAVEKMVASMAAEGMKTLSDANKRVVEGVS